MAILQNKFVREDGSIIGSSVIISCKYTSDVNSQTNLTVGDTTAAEVDVEIRNPAKEIVAGEKLTYYQIEDGTENLVGIFYAEAPTVATKTSIRFKAYDGKAKLAVDFSEWLNNNQARFPMTVRSLGNAACEVAGLVLAADSFQFENLSIPAFYAQGVTCRQIISWIAQLNGSFVSCNTAGEIFFDWYRETNISIGKSDFSQDGLSKKTYSTDLIQRVQFKQETNDVGVIYPADADGNVFSISQNGIAALLDSDTLRTIAQHLYNKLKTVTYTPLSVKLPKRTAKIKAGDIISVTDGNGETVKTYVMKVYLDSSGTQISSTGDQDYADKAAVSSEQYKNIPGKVLLLEKSVDGLRIENADTAGKVADLELNVDGIEARVSDTEKGLAEIQLSPGQVKVTAQQKEILGTAYSFSVDGSGNLILSYEGEQPGYSINKNGELVLEYEGDTPPETWIGEDGVLYSTEDSVVQTELIGTLSSIIDADGTWEMEFDQDGEVVSSIRFDLASRRFVFDGEIVVSDNLKSDITTITNDTLKTTNVLAENLQVNAAHIVGELTFGDGSYYINPSAETNYFSLPGLSITSDGAEFTGKIVADSGKIGDCYISNGKLEVPGANIIGALTFGDGSYYINPSAETNYFSLPGLSITSDGAKFDGTVVANGGTIGGWNIGTIKAYNASTLVYSDEALYSNEYTESTGAYVGYMIRVALTPQYLILYGYSNSRVAVARKVAWTTIISAVS